MRCCASPSSGASTTAVLRVNSAMGSKRPACSTPNAAAVSSASTSRNLTFCAESQRLRAMRSFALRGSASQLTKCNNVPSGQTQPQNTRPSTAVSASMPKPIHIQCATFHEATSAPSAFNDELSRNHVTG